MNSGKVTVAQKTKILHLAGHSCFSDEEREKLRAVICSYDQEKAYRVLYQLLHRYQQRTGLPIEWKYFSELPGKFKRTSTPVTPA